MNESTSPIIEHIPRFLEYCKKEGLSEKTQENYTRYLNKFISWLKKENKNNLLPHEFTTAGIESYRLYLASYNEEKNHSLKKISQNYYLIALRALLSYFTAKGIESLPMTKIRLLGGIKTERSPNYLNSRQIKALLDAPTKNNPSGLRDKAILGVLIFNGLKVAQLKELNQSQIEEKISGEALEYVREYLKSRGDDNEALFINYRSRKDANKRLTVRSVERIVLSYGKKIGLPFLITPETLRWAKPQALSKEEIIIKKVQPHKTFKIKSYADKKSIKITLDRENKNDHSPTWHTVENIINKEIGWLKDSIPTLPESYKGNPPFLKYDDSILRKIAILTVSGSVGVIEFVSDNKDILGNLTGNKNLNKVSRHGQVWHKKMMDVIYEYFKLRNYKIILEPVLNYGRADLEIYSNNNDNHLYIEVGTVSLFKLWYNLSTMKNTTFLIIPSENKVIEFNT